MSGQKTYEKQRKRKKNTVCMYLCLQIKNIRDKTIRYIRGGKMKKKKEHLFNRTQRWKRVGASHRNIAELWLHA